MTERIAVRYAGGEHLISLAVMKLARGRVRRPCSRRNTFPTLIDALREAHRIAMRPEPSEKDEAAK